LVFNGLRKYAFSGATDMKRFNRKLSWFTLIIILSLAFEGLAQSNSSKKPPALIRDTDVADETDKTEAQKPKKLSPIESEKSIGIGNQYFKKKNYLAAINRYIEALEYQPDSIPACEALGRAYEKNGDFSKALTLYRNFIEKYPKSRKISDFRAKIAKLEKQP
jgi:tetratricopeptide (TPR) repeat protein